MVIERQVKRMQTVIELTRVLRERHNLSLKVHHGLFTILYASPNQKLLDTPA